jgi:hypothetical protein
MKKDNLATAEALNANFSPQSLGSTLDHSTITSYSLIMAP